MADASVPKVNRRTLLKGSAAVAAGASAPRDWAWETTGWVAAATSRGASGRR